MTRTQIALAVLTGALLVVGIPAAAQLDEERPAPPPSAAQLALDDDIEQEAALLSSEEKVAAAQARIAEMQEVLAATNQLLKKVREEDQDLLRINCINEKLAAIKGFLKVSEQSYVGLKDAAAADDTEAEIHHYTLIGIADQKVADLGEEALTCVGEVQIYADETSVDRREDPDIADIELVTIDDDAFADEFATEELPELTPFQ